MDEPSGIAGARLAAQPLEVLLVALGSCVAGGIRAHAVARGNTLSRQELAVEGTARTRSRSA